MADGRGNALHATVVERHDTAVGQRQLDLALALLTRNLSRHGAIHLIRQPVFAGHCLEL